MLSSSQIDTLSGIACNYEHYVIYYYADYHDYSPGENRDSRVVIYVGSDITVENDSFTFGDDVECYYFTSGKYISSYSCPDSFSVENSEIVYTDLVSYYPSLCFFENKYQNFHPDLGYYFVFIIVLVVSLFVFFRVIFGGNK